MTAAESTAANVLAEQALLGALLADDAAFDAAAERVSEASFFERRHRLIWRAIVAVAVNKATVDIITVSEFLRADNSLQDVGGLPYLGALIESAPSVSVSSVRAYADNVADKAALRALHRAGTDIAERAKAPPPGASVADIVEQAERDIFAAGDAFSCRSSAPVHISAAASDAFRWVSDLHGGATPSGLLTGYPDLDETLGGLQNSDLILLAGATSTGKTALAMNIVESAVIKYGVPSLVFSLEMSLQQITLRFAASLSRVPLGRLRNPATLNELDWPRLTSFVQIVSSAPLYIDSTTALTPSAIRARCRRMKREQGIGLIVIDYFQLLASDDPRAARMQSKATVMADVSRALKLLAMELDVPVLALSQLNREGARQDNKRPQLHHLRDTGALEQDADVVLLLFRDDSSDMNHRVEVITAKQRNGPLGSAYLTFLPQFLRFESHSPPRDFSGQSPL